MLKNIITSLAIFLTFFMIFNLSRQIQTAIKSGDRLLTATDELKNLQDRNRELKKAASEQDTLDFVERQARDKLNLSRPNETVLLIDPTALQLITEATPSSTPSPIPHWQGWLNLFGF